MNSVSQLFQEVPDFGEIIFYAIIVAVMVFGVVLGRYIIRGLVNRRVRGIHSEGLDLGDLSSMSEKGLLTDEELKKIRRRFAERQLAETKNEKEGASPMDLLRAIEADPSRATSLLPQSSDHAKRALEDLKKSEPRSVEDQLREQLGESASDPSRPAPEVPPPASAASRSPSQPKSAPRPASPEPPKQKPEGPASQGMDLDAMLAKGLLSKREYDLLMARVKKGGGA